MKLRKKIKKIEKVVEEEVVEEKPQGKTRADVTVSGTGEVMLSYSEESNGENWVELATNMAKKKGWKVVFS